MARLNPSPIRMYRGTTAQHSQYAGPIGELTVDTDKNTVVVQNGTQGGVPLAQEKRQVIAGDGITVNGGASGTLASDITVAVDQTWLGQNVPAGPEGPTGPAGADGAPGAAATVAVGSVTTGAAGTQASVTNSGTANAAVFNFTIPRGAKGDKGDTGATGPAGEYTAGDGLSISGDSIAVNQTWLDNYIDGLVNGGNLVTAGDGIDVTASEGKAEIAVDDTVVRTSGDQTIAGGKTFTNMVSFYQDIQLVGALEEGLDNSPQIDMPVNITRGTLPTGNVSAGIRVLDNADTNLALIQGFLNTNGAISTEIVAYKNAASSNEVSRISAVYPISGEPYGIAPTTPAAASANEIVTVDYLKGANSGVVHTTGDETIAGAKTFTAGPIVRTSSTRAYFNLSAGAMTAGTPPASGSDYDMGIRFIDKSGEVLGMYKYSYDDAGDASLYMQVGSPSADDDDNVSITLNYTADGSKYATAPSTRATPVNNEIVTVDYLKQYVEENADNSVYLPLYFQVGTTEEIHTFLPAGVKTVRRANFEADGAGTGGLTLTMARDIGATTSMTVGSSATNCSAYAGHAVMFTISGTSNQTEVAALLVFE